MGLRITAELEEAGMLPKFTRRLLIPENPLRV
jgi:hypothetical protein